MSEIVGETLTRKKKVHVGFDRVRVLGKQGDAYVIASAEEHRPPILISATTLANEYGAKVDDEETDGQRMRRADFEATEAARAEYRKYARNTSATPHSASPEGQFRAAAEAQAAADDAG
jgi:hypothetical protein